jgi:hypothetical protein
MRLCLWEVRWCRMSDHQSCRFWHETRQMMCQQVWCVPRAKPLCNNLKSNQTLLLNQRSQAENVSSENALDRVEVLKRTWLRPARPGLTRSSCDARPQSPPHQPPTHHQTKQQLGTRDRRPLRGTHRQPAPPRRPPAVSRFCMPPPFTPPPPNPSPRNPDTRLRGCCCAYCTTESQTKPKGQAAGQIDSRTGCRPSMMTMTGPRPKLQ